MSDRRSDDEKEKENLKIIADRKDDLIQIANFWVSVKGAITVAGLIGGGLKWCLMFSAIWAAFSTGFIEWVKEGLQK